MNIDLNPFFEKESMIKDVKNMTLDEFMTLHNMIENLLEEIEKINPKTGYLTRRQVGEIKLLASEFKRIRKQRDSLRSCFLDKTIPDPQDLGSRTSEQEEILTEERKRALFQKQKKRTM